MATYSSILAWTIAIDRGTWLAAVHRVAKSRTQLKRPSSSRKWTLSQVAHVDMETLKLYSPTDFYSTIVSIP